MQNYQAKPVAASASSCKPKPNAQAKDGVNEKNNGNTTSAELVMLVRIHLEDIDGNTIDMRTAEHSGIGRIEAKGRKDSVAHGAMAE